MQFDIRRQGIEVDEAAKARLQKRLDFALGRLGHHVTRVWVHLADENGQRGGIGNRCRILVRLGHMPDVLVEDRDSDINVLIDRTVNRAGLAVRREVSRRYDRTR
ncbi:MAG: HPF/RaiA family ribosome-associated protein [Gemmataceae bacterium]